MALTTRTLPALMNGISKQPPILRSPDQTEDELNTWSRIAKGLSRRPPTTTVAKLAGVSLANATVHHINRDINERYTVIISSSGIRVFDEATGAEKTVNAPGGWAYLNNGNSLVTNGQFTSVTTGWTPTNATLSVVSGKLRVTNTAVDGYASQSFTTVIGTTYRVNYDTVNGTGTATLKIGNSAGNGALLTDAVAGTNKSATFVATATTTFISLVSAGASTLTADFDNISVYVDGLPVSVRAATVADYTIIVNTDRTVLLEGVTDDEVAQPTHRRYPGGLRGTPLVINVAVRMAAAQNQYAANPVAPGSYTTVKTYTDLPAVPPAGAVYKVLGDAKSTFVSYYLRGDGSVWNETVKPGLQNGVDAKTMPHTLIREADGTFTFAPFSWQPRRVGDYDTNPAPAFVNHPIKDVFFYQNRLAFLSDESVMFSCAADYGDFWRKTVFDYIDSDAIGASISTPDVAVLDYAVPFEDGVMLFSRQRQFALSNGDSGLSAHSLAITPVTRYIMSQGVRPAALGSQSFFATDAHGSTAVQEYTRLSGSNPTEAADITAHVPGLLATGVSQIIAAPDIDALFVLAKNSATPTKMYAYQFFWDGDKKLQSAWRVWDLVDGTPISGSYESGALTLLVSRPDGFFLERMDLTPEATSPSQSHLIFLDRSQVVSGVYNSGTDKTTFTTTFNPNATNVRAVLANTASVPERVIPPSTYSLSSNVLTVNGNYGGVQATIGNVYTSSVSFSRQYPWDWQGRPLSSGRLTLHTYTLNLIDTAYLRAVVYPYGLAPAGLDPGLKHETVFTGFEIGSAATVIGAQSYWSGSWTFSVAGNAEAALVALVNDSPFSSTFVSAEWEGLFFSRAL